MCNIPCMPQGSIRHKPVVQHALHDTIPICHSTGFFMHRLPFVKYPICYRARYVTRPLCNMPFVSQPRYVFMHRVLCVTYPICYRVRYVTRPLCNMPYVSQSLYVTVESSLCTGLLVLVYYTLYATGSDMPQSRCAICPLCHSAEFFMHRVLCVTYPICHRVGYFTSPLRYMPFEPHSLYVAVESSLCTGFLA